MTLNETTSPVPSDTLDAFIVAVPLKRVLQYLRHPRNVLPLEAAATDPLQEGPLCLDTEALHINLGTPGIDEPDCPVEENLHVLESAMKEGWKCVPVLFSGQLERAMDTGLISGETLLRLRLNLMALPSADLGE